MDDNNYKADNNSAESGGFNNGGFNYVAYNQKNKADVNAKISLALGIGSFSLGLIFLAPLAIIFAVMAKRKGFTGGYATAGLILGVVGTVLFALVVLYFVFIAIPLWSGDMYYWQAI